MTRIHFFIDGENLRFHSSKVFGKVNFEADPKKMADNISKSLGYEIGEIYYFTSSLPYPENHTYDNDYDRDRAINQYIRRGAHAKLAVKNKVRYFSPQLSVRYDAKGNARYVQKQVDMAMGAAALMRKIKNPKDAVFLGTFDSDFIPILHQMSADGLLEGESAPVFVPRFRCGNRGGVPKCLDYRNIAKVVVIDEKRYLSFRSDGVDWNRAVKATRDRVTARLAERGITLDSLVTAKPKPVGVRIKASAKVSPIRPLVGDRALLKQLVGDLKSTVRNIVRTGAHLAVGRLTSRPKGKV